MYETYITIMEIVPQNNLENIIPFELILHIAEQNPSALHAVCSVNKHANEYVNEHILKYKSMFAKEIEYDHKYTMSDGSVKGQYSVLPNGSKYGQFLEFVCVQIVILFWLKGIFKMEILRVYISNGILRVKKIRVVTILMDCYTENTENGFLNETPG